jgi:L-ascorbate metabolism protein UlaG (beta-lactamase superfamily)
MKLTKLIHACLLIENDAGNRLVIDPGSFSELPEDLSRIVAVIATEEHGDHFGLENVKKIVAANPDVAIFSTPAVAEQLATETIACTAIDDDETVQSHGFTLSFYPTPHAPVYQTSPCLSLPVKVDNYLFYSSDTFRTIPDHVSVVALPASGPWYKFSESVDQAKNLSTDTFILTHDSFNSETGNKYLPTGLARFIENMPQTHYLKPGESL